MHALICGGCTSALHRTALEFSGEHVRLRREWEAS